MSSDIFLKKLRVNGVKIFCGKSQSDFPKDKNTAFKI
jgi:hypothetical protein